MISAEAGFTGACKAGKAHLYVRYILNEISMPQDEATILFIDNNGAFYITGLGRM